MNASLTRKIHKLFELQSLRDKLKSTYDEISAKYKQGVEDILPDLSEDERNFNLITERKAEGSTGTVDYIVGYGEAIRRKSEASETDQEWLSNLPVEYTRSKYELNKAAIQNALKAGDTTLKDLRSNDLTIVPTMRLTLRKTPVEEDIESLIDEGLDAIE